MEKEQQMLPSPSPPASSSSPPHEQPEEVGDDTPIGTPIESEDDVGQSQSKIRKRRNKLSQFFDDEAELSGDDLVSDDEVEASDDDQLDPQLVDLDAKDLSSDEEEEVRRLYQKQLDTDDRRQILLLQERIEENELAIGQRRRRKFRWQNKELMENSLKRHYDPDDDDSQEGYDDDDDDDVEYGEIRLRRPTTSLMLGSTRLVTNTLSPDMDPHDDESESNFDVPRRTYSTSKASTNDAGPSLLSEDSCSNTMSRMTAPTIRTSVPLASNMNRYLFRDKEIVEALSTRETVVVATREEKDRVIQRELKRVLQSESIFDQLYS